MAHTAYQFYYGKPFALERNGQKLLLDVGDDAVPYVGPAMISVADGTGGRSFEKQRSVNPALLRRETSFDAATAGCGDWSRGDYREQYDENFSYLYDIGDDYDMGPRKSSYFGARLVTIFMRRLMEEELFPQESLAERFAPLMDEQTREATLAGLEETIVASLKTLLSRAARNCQMSVHSGNEGVSLMGTTYTGVVFHEDEEQVHLLTVQAGDSLGIALTPVQDDEGHDSLCFRLILPAQERKTDGGITNCIGANHDFYVRCAYTSVRKPCAVLVTSDGCFDAFTSMLRFEHFVMDKLCAANTASLQDAMEKMREFYDMGVCTDDSSTMAVAAFGFDAFERMSHMAYRRKKWMERLYPAGLGDMAREREAEEAVAEIQSDIIAGENAVLRESAQACWEDSDWIRKRCAAMAQTTYTAELNRALAGLRAQESVMRQRIAQGTSQIRRLVEEDWLTLRERCVAEERYDDPMQESRPGNLGILNRFADRRDSPGELRYVREELDGMRRNLREDYAGSARYAKDYGELCAAADEKTDNYKQLVEMRALLESMQAAYVRIERAETAIRDRELILERAFRRMLQEEAAQISGFCQALVDGDDDALRAFSPERGPKAERVIGEIRECQQWLRDYPRKQDGVAQEVGSSVFRERPVKIIRECMGAYEEGTASMSIGLYEELRRKLAGVREKFADQLSASNAIDEAKAKYLNEFESHTIKRS